MTTADQDKRRKARNKRKATRKRRRAISKGWCRR